MTGPAEVRRRTTAVKSLPLLLIAGLLLGGCAMDQQKLAAESGVPKLPAAAPGTIDLAERALAEERYQDAEQLVQRILAGDPENSTARLLQAELLFARGDRQAAADGFAALVDDPAVAARALQGKGLSLILLGKPQLGHDQLVQAVGKDPSLWRAWNGLGYCYDTQGQWEKATEAYSKAIAANPESAVIYNNRGYSRLMQKRLEEATSDFNRALELDPELDVARDNLRLALAWSGKYVRAMSGADQRNLAKVLNNVGYVALLRGDFQNAEAYLNRAMEVDPAYNAVASRNLAYLKHLKELERSESQDAGN